jgi:Xaa-Pro dipeptidase
LTSAAFGSFLASVIVYHTTPFGTAERLVRGIARAQEARDRLRPWLDHASVPGVVLTSPGAVAWACGGLPPPVDRTAATDLVWAVVSADDCWLVTTNVEAERIRAEYDPAAHGFSGLAEVPWYAPQEDLAAAAADLAGVSAEQLASDGHPAFGRDATADLIGLRLELSRAERADLADLGADAARAAQDALAQWRPGERDLDIQARCAAGLEAAGADAPVLIVGGDDRLERYRHPMAAGEPVRRLVMVVIVARRGGLHVALTRFASAVPDGGYARLRARVLRIEDAVLAACAPGATYGHALESLASGYAGAGAENEWEHHYQGGPIGFAQREFEIAPGQSGSRWYRERIAAGHALAWNPSLPGGAKSEDTYLVSAAGLDRVTSAPGWPVEPDDSRGRPAVLEVGT